MAFTSLVLILQSSDKFEPSNWGYSGIGYFSVLIALVGTSIAAFIFSSITWIGVASGEVSVNSRAADFAAYTFTLGLGRILFSLPLLIVPFSWPASVVVACAAIILFAIWTSLPTQTA